MKTLGNFPCSGYNRRRKDFKKRNATLLHETRKNANEEWYRGPRKIRGDFIWKLGTKNIQCFLTCICDSSSWDNKNKSKKT